jgi:hypothetical protein
LNEIQKYTLIESKTFECGIVLLRYEAWQQYKEILWDKLEDMLEIARYEVDKIELELVNSSEIMQHIIC